MAKRMVRPSIESLDINSTSSRSRIFSSGPRKTTSIPQKHLQATSERHSRICRTEIGVHGSIRVALITLLNLSSSDLTATARQGVLWLNTSREQQTTLQLLLQLSSNFDLAVTVEAHKAGSHSKQGWVNLTRAALHAVAARPGEGVVILAWGAHAQKMTEGLDEVSIDLVAGMLLVD